MIASGIHNDADVTIEEVEETDEALGVRKVFYSLGLSTSEFALHVEFERLDELRAFTDFLQERSGDFAFAPDTVGPLWYFDDGQLRIYYSAVPLPALQFVEYRFLGVRLDDIVVALDLAREDLDE